MDNKIRRVVVTGMGAVTPLGLNLADSWDGTYKGAPCPQGAYVYLITYTTVSQPSHPQRVKGTVLLLR